MSSDDAPNGLDNDPRADLHPERNLDNAHIGAVVYQRSVMLDLRLLPLDNGFSPDVQCGNCEWGEMVQVRSYLWVGVMCGDCGTPDPH